MRRDPRLAPASLISRGVDPSGAYAFAVDLSEAIVASIDDHRPSLELRGVDLSPAVQRALWIDLTNRPSLYTCYLRQGGSAQAAGRLEADVIARLVPAAGVELVERAPLVERLAVFRRRLRPTQRIAPARIVAITVHPKFTAFLGPIANRVDGLAVVKAERFVDWKGVGRGTLAAYPEICALAFGLDLFIRTARPNAVVAAEGNAPADGVLGAVARAHGVPSVLVQQGWPPHVHAGFRNLPFDAMLVWGQGFAELLRPWNQSLRFEATGSHIVNAAEGDGGRMVAVFLQSPSQLIAPEHVDSLISLASDLAGQTGVLVREHPSSPLDEGARQRLRRSGATFANAPDYALSDVLSQSAAAVSIYSTTLFEAVPSRVMPISLNETSLPTLSPSLSAWGVGVETDDAAAAAAAALTPTLDSGAAAAFERSFFASVGQDAATRAAALIERLAEG